jgi:hypothetical protein
MTKVAPLHSARLIRQSVLFFFFVCVLTLGRPCAITLPEVIMRWNDMTIRFVQRMVLAAYQGPNGLAADKHISISVGVAEGKLLRGERRQRRTSSRIKKKSILPITERQHRVKD